MITEIYEQLIQEEQLLQEDWKSGLRTAAITTGIGLGSLGIASGQTPTKVSTKQTEEKTSLRQLFKGEYETIEKAAIRNNVKPGTEDFYILLAIRKAENGASGLEFGIMHPKAKGTNLDTQAGWAAATVRKNRERWKQAGKKEDFITFLGRRYCPVGAENDPKGLNKHWIKNVTHWTSKLREV